MRESKCNRVRSYRYTYVYVRTYRPAYNLYNHSRIYKCGNQSATACETTGIPTYTYGRTVQLIIFIIIPASINAGIKVQPRAKRQVYLRIRTDVPSSL